MKSKKLLMLAVLGTLLLGSRSMLAQESDDFMPKGGKDLLIQLLGHPLDTAELHQIATTKRNTEEWQTSLAPRTGAMNGRERRTLSEYLAVNMPLVGKNLEAVGKNGDEATALPPDGQELAVNFCQFCHSFFTGYLMIERDVQGWLGTFETPFHSEIEMTEKERETFARYSAINMPMKIGDVPEDLRF